MSEYLNSEQRTVLVKVLAYLSLVRWYNILLVIIAQYLAAFFLLNEGVPLTTLIADPYLHTMVFSCGLIIAGGYLINAFYDQEKDLANRPKKLIIGRIISKSFALNTYLLFNFTGVLIGWLSGFRILVFLSVFSFLLWFYSHKLKKITFIGDLSATFLSVCSFFIVGVYYWELNWIIVLYVAFIVIAELIREIVKDLEAIKGDILYGYDTVPVAIGIPRTKLLLYGLSSLAILPVLGVYLLMGWDNVMYFLVFALLLLGVVVLLLSQAQEKKDYVAVNNVIKTIIVLGVLSIVLI